MLSCSIWLAGGERSKIRRGKVWENKELRKWFSQAGVFLSFYEQVGSKDPDRETSQEVTV